MMGINTTGLAEIVFGGIGVPLVQGQAVNACDELKLVKWYATHNRTPPSAERAVAPVQCQKPLTKIDLKLDFSAMTASGLYFTHDVFTRSD
tara:strand:- start:1383 stop:1655 length:273 start_codon:yes stop_codon:yes gene_type:complete